MSYESWEVSVVKKYYAPWNQNGSCQEAITIQLFSDGPVSFQKFVLDADVTLANQPVCNGYAESFDELDR